MHLEPPILPSQPKPWVLPGKAIVCSSSCPVAALGLTSWLCFGVVMVLLAARTINLPFVGHCGWRLNM